jgi:hypothetical protein
MRLTSFPLRRQTSWSAPNTYRGSSRGRRRVSHPQRGERRCFRSLETPRYPPAGRLKARGSGGRPVPVSTQLGRGAAHSASETNAVRFGVSSEHGSPINAWDSGTSGPDALPRSTPHHEAEHRLRSGSVPFTGPVGRPALPCPSSAVRCAGARSSLVPHADHGGGETRDVLHEGARAARVA